MSEQIHQNKIEVFKHTNPKSVAAALIVGDPQRVFGIPNSKYALEGWYSTSFIDQFGNVHIFKNEVDQPLGRRYEHGMAPIRAAMKVLGKSPIYGTVRWDDKTGDTYQIFQREHTTYHSSKKAKLDSAEKAGYSWLEAITEELDRNPDKGVLRFMRLGYQRSPLYTADFAVGDSHLVYEVDSEFPGMVDLWRSLLMEVPFVDHSEVVRWSKMVGVR